MPKKRKREGENNYNSRKKEALMANRLAPKEVKTIMEKFGQFGLRADEHEEYFTWQQDGRKLFIPKQDKIPFEIEGSAKLKYVNTVDYIRKLIEDEKDKLKEEKDN